MERRLYLTKVASYFGPLSLTVHSNTARGRIDAVVDCTSDWRPERVELRVPHPVGTKAKKVEGGVYDPETERVLVEPFRGYAEVRLHY